MTGRHGSRTADHRVPVVDDAAVDLSRIDLDVPGVLETMLEAADARHPTSIGFPAATDIDYSPILPFFATLWNNLGDPHTHFPFLNTKPAERAVVRWFGDLLGLPAHDQWGYVTGGGTDASHFSIAKVLKKLQIPAVRVQTDAWGEMDYNHLDDCLARNRHRPAIVVANAGTTMTEAVDDTARISDLLRANAIPSCHVHVDAALSGIPLALDGKLRLVPGQVDSVVVSGHKFFATPIPSGLVMMRRATHIPGQHIEYTTTLDTTVAGSRCGQAAVMLWYAIATYGADGHRDRARHARAVAQYTVDRLNTVGWPAWRHPDAFTVVFPTPGPDVTEKWLLATQGMMSHTVCVPGVTTAQIDAFAADIARAHSLQRASLNGHDEATVFIPQQRFAASPPAIAP
jgi:histidine decarboxylase